VIDCESIEIPTYEIARLLKIPDLDISLAWCDSVRMMRIQLNGHIHAAILGLFAAVLHGCSPLYVSDASITSTPSPQSLDVARLASEPVAVLGVVAPPTLQGFSPSLSLALVRAIANVRPPIHAVPGYETLSLLNEEGLAQDYADLISGYTSGGILERQRLRRIGSAVGSRYLMLPGVAEFDQSVVDKYEAVGLKLVRTRLTSLRLWLQLWDAHTGQIIWESGGEVTAVTQLLRAKRTVPLDRIAQKLWFQMIQKGLLRGKTDDRFFATGEEQEENPSGL
jgi:hypothetical protein